MATDIKTVYSGNLFAAFVAGCLFDEAVHNFVIDNSTWVWLYLVATFIIGWYACVSEHS